MVTELSIGITAEVIKMFSLGALSFIISILLTPALTHFLYKYKLWQKREKKKSIDGANLQIISKFHQGKGTHTPCLGGLLIWIVPLVMIFVFFLLSKTGYGIFEKMNFLSRGETWLPLFALIVASLLGLVDDLSQIFGKGKYVGGGLSLSKRILIIVLIGLIGGLWFYFKLDVETIHIPGNGDFNIGWWYILLFIVVMLGTYSGGVIDGLDGLAGGSFATFFTAFAIIAIFQGQINLATFCFVLVGAILAFLWFNIPPARFYMGETGVMGLCATLAVVAFLTDSVFILPIIAFPLVVESGSCILQLLSKKIRKKKIFLAAPIHHHFEAKGWPAYKVTMRFWVMGLVAALIGVGIRLLG